MKKMISSIVILFSMFFLAGCTTQGDINGVVSDQNGVALSDVQVKATSSKGDTLATTNGQGSYSLSGLALNESIVITVTKEGYITDTHSVSLSDSSPSYTHNVTLESEEVVVLTGSVSGKITDVTGNAIADARVFTGSNEAMTDENGLYTLTANAGEHISISVEKNNYATNNRVVVVVEDTATALDMAMITVDVVETFPADKGTTITTKGAEVVLPAGIFTDENGTLYTGEVTAKVSYNRVTTLNGEAAFPGDYIGEQTDGTDTVLQSYGFIDVTLEDAAGNPLQLASGAEATLTYPMDNNIEETPATIPLWYYDLEKGMWIEDGVATYDAATDTYTGNVSHFTTWNLDKKFNGATVEGCIVDANDVLIPSAYLYVSTAGWHKNGQIDDAEGKFSLINAPSNVEMTLRAKVAGMMSQEEKVTLLPGEVKMVNCLKVDIDAAEVFASVTGRIVDADNAPISGVWINILDENGAELTYAQTDENGTFISEDFERTAGNKITVSFNANTDEGNVDVRKEYLMHPVNALTDIGTIEIKVMTFTGCIEFPDGSSDFSNYHKLINIDGPFTGHRHFEQDGTFSYTALTDYQTHSLYFNPEYSGVTSYTKKIDFLAGSTAIDNTTCVKLEETFDVNMTVSASITSNDDAFLYVIYDTYANYTYPSPWGQETLIGDEYPHVTSGNFQLTKNGVYYVDQYADDCSDHIFNGTININVAGTDYSLTIPDAGLSYGAWVGYAIEVYQGTVKVIELNKVTEFGEGS